MGLGQLRNSYHKAICRQILGYQTAGVPSIADKGITSSMELAQGILARMRFPLSPNPPHRQRVATLFELFTRDYLEEALDSIHHLRPGEWIISMYEDAPIFDQYEYLYQQAQALRRYPRLCATLKHRLLMPSILMARWPILDQEVNRDASIVRGEIAGLTSLRTNSFPEPKSILHAGIFCRWTLQGDRGQNAQIGILNLIRNRKGNLPHVVAVTAEPLPTRIASLALGTGDLDCVYHFALPELMEAIREIDNEDQMDMLKTLVEGRRLRDISDLPFDLAI